MHCPIDVIKEYLNDLGVIDNYDIETKSVLKTNQFNEASSTIKQTTILIIKQIRYIWKVQTARRGVMVLI